jgi:hypothetical protein
MGERQLSDSMNAFVVRILRRAAADIPRLNEAQAREYTCGSGILLSTTHVLTCAHVVAEALQIEDGEFQLEAPGEWVTLDLPFYPDGKQTRLAEVTKWYPRLDDASNELEDVALLKLAEPIEGWNPEPVWASWQLGDYLEHRFIARGFGKTESTTEFGQCLSPTTPKQWIELRPDQREIGPGYSGGPVFDEETKELIGMLVAYYQNEHISYLIPACRLEKYLPKYLVQTEPMAKLLGKTINREKQMQPLDKMGLLSIAENQAMPPNQCFIYACCEEDEPNFFAQYAALKPYMDADKRLSTTFRDFTPVHIEIKEKSKAGVSMALNEALIGDVQHWLSSGPSLKVVYVSTELEPSTPKLIQGIKEYLEMVDTRNKKKCLIVLVACCQPDKVGLRLKMQQRSLWKKITKQGAICLEPLSTINKGHLLGWLDTLSNEYSRHFSIEQIRIEFTGLLQENEEKRYRDITDNVFSILSNNIRSTPARQTL